MLEFTWQSFVFAVINFLILAALLYRFLHRPLLAVLDKRRQSLAQARKDAEKGLDNAKRKQAEYEAKLAEAEDEARRVVAEAREAAEQARRESLERAKSEAERESARLKQAYEQERRDALRDLQREVAQTVTGLAQRVLDQAAGADLDAKLHEKLLAELEALASETHTPAGRNTARVRVVSARDPDASRRKALEKSIRAVAGDAAEIAFETDEALGAGARLEFADTAVDATLSDLLAAVGEHAAEEADPGRKEDQDP